MSDPLDPQTPTPPRSARQRRLALILAPLLVAAGLAVFVLLVKHRPRARQAGTTAQAAPVQVVEARPTDLRVRIPALGTMEPARRLALRPQVTGMVARVADTCLPGGLLSAGEEVCALDEQDFRLELTMRQAQLEQARMSLSLEEGNRKVAAKEWEMLRRSKRIEAEDKDAYFALRGPQFAQAKAAVNQALAALERAELDLERTRVRAPFDALVLECPAVRGARVSPADTLAVLAGIDRVYVRLDLPEHYLAWIEPPGPDRPGAPVRLHNATDPQARPIGGRVLRILGEMESQGHMAQVLVEVRPADLEDGWDSRLLRFGAVYRAEIQGPLLRDVIPLPEGSLDDQGRVMLAGPDGHLLLRPVHPVWRDQGLVYVEEEFGCIGPGDRIVVTPLAEPREGMPLRIVPGTPASP